VVVATTANSNIIAWASDDDGDIILFMVGDWMSALSLLFYGLKGKNRVGTIAMVIIICMYYVCGPFSLFSLFTFVTITAF
jgi:hypothetical protein